ncbi:MAG: hypothetical protein KME45_26780 [Stenomitos rutilans HA7619-LM2]|jgi:predicted transcriptional regulator|nr:hypothetical protein [Stenomitos rutilans HA7619-LM2]
MSIREQIFRHMEAIEASGDIGSLNAAILAWLGEVDETDRHLTVLEQKLAESRAALSVQDEDADIDNAIGFEPLTKDQRLQRLDQRWERYQQTGRTVSHDEMKTWAASLATKQ